MGQPMLFEDRKGYRIAREMAVEALAAVDPEMAASERGVDYDPERSLFTIPFLGTYLYVAFPSGEVAMASRERVGALAILAPHYLVYHGEPLRKEGWVAYRDMPGARPLTHLRSSALLQSWEGWFQTWVTPHLSYPRSHVYRLWRCYGASARA